MADGNEHPGCLSDYLRGNLDASERLLVQRHVEQCIMCQQELQIMGLLDRGFDPISLQNQAEGVDRVFAQARQAAIRQRDGGDAARPTHLPPREPAPDFSHPKAFPWAPSLMSLVAILLVGIGISHMIPSTESSSRTIETRFVEKGSGDSALAQDLLSLSFAVQRPEGRLERGRNQWSYPNTSQLFFRGQLSKDGFLLLVHVAGDNVFSLTRNNEGGNILQVHAGTWDLGDGEHLLGYSLEGFSGKQRFVAIFSESAFALDPTLENMLRSEMRDGDSLPASHVVTDEVSIEVNEPPAQ